MLNLYLRDGGAMRYLFKMNNVDVSKRDQIASILEKYTENNSREKMGKVWDITDKLNDMPRNNLSEEERSKRKKKINIMGILYLLVGALFILTQYFMKLNVWLYVIGIALIIIGALFIGPLNISERFFKAADTVLEKRNSEVIDGVFVISDKGVGFEGEGLHRLENISSVISSKDLIGLIDGESIIILQKEDIVEGDVSMLLEDLRERIKVYEI